MEFFDSDLQSIFAKVREPFDFGWPQSLKLTGSMGNLDPMPNLGSPSTLPEIMSLVPVRDSSALGVERQLRTETSILRSDPSIKDPVMDQVSSQALEGNLSSLP